MGVLCLLLATGWAANHFVALMPVIGRQQHLGPATLDAIFAIYAVGLLPGLLVGGRASDAFGRQSVALAGSTLALAGTVAMLLSQHTDALLAGRFIVGLGVGLIMTSCTAWASDLQGAAGAAAAGAVLTAGFAVGPFAGGLTARAGRSAQTGVGVSFAVAAAIVVVATCAVLLTARTDASSPATRHATRPTVSPKPAPHATARALGWALPLAPWVFASATLGFVTIPARLHTGLAAPIAAGAAALIVNGISGLVQVLARALRWGPQAGTAGAVLAALGYAATAAAPPTMGPVLGVALFLVLGCASGLLLREGLIDLEAAAPQRLRGALTGVFYVVTYVGFGVPLILATAGPGVSATILSAMAVLASAAAVGRALRLRRDDHRRA
ncbi:MFS transporter [Mycobacterium sp.]|uniref:MFS transporter n=1 Tax=Mycobacterium sp. TaxID=1785 RepID=UPI0025DE347F|nr:MFS transporter [Mycobacterium sp.]